MLTKGKGIRWSVTQTPQLILFPEKGRSITVTSKAKEFVLLEIAKRLLNGRMKMSARETWRPWSLISTDGKPWLQSVQLGGRQCSKAFTSLKIHLPNKLRQRDKRGRPETREIDQQLTTSAHCVEGTVIPELVFSATQGAVREPPIRAQHHSLSRLKDANICLIRGGGCLNAINAGDKH